MNQALSHLRVLDLSRVLAGPWATQLLADLGAEVIKIERPQVGDDTRGWGPPFVCDAEGQPSDAAYYLCANRGKKSVTLDITQPRGQEIIRQLVQSCDVLVENYKVGGLKKYGLDYDSLREINPRLVYCSVTGFGQTGPYASLPGYDYIVQGMSGLMSVTGPADGEPHKVGVAVTDLFTGMYASSAILAALASRDQTGVGQHIDLALFDCAVAMLANVNMNYLVGGKTPPRLGNGHPNIVPYQVFSAADGHFILACGNDAQFMRVLDLLGLSALATDARFARNADRVAHRDALIPQLAQAFACESREHWLAALDAAGVPAGPINTIDEAFADPQIQARQMQISLDRDGVAIPQVACPIRFSGTPIVYEDAPPMLGGHTKEVLRNLGLSDIQIGALHNDGIV